MSCTSDRFAVERDFTKLEALGRDPKDLAADISRQVSITSGIKVKPGISRGKGGVLVGYVQPRILKP